MNAGFKLSSSIFLASCLCFAFSAFAEGECSRDWAVGKGTGKNFKIIGLGLSSQTDPKAATEEARAAAFKDISLQLQSSIKSSSEVKESQSESSFSANSLLTSNTEDLVGLKAVKSGKNLEEKVTDCEVYEFNVQAAYEDQSSKLTVVQDKIDQVTGFGDQKKWINVIREYPNVKPLIVSNAAIIKRADLFKAYANIPGPGWGERFDKSSAQLDDLDKKARSNLVFLFPKDQFEEAVTELQGTVTNAGAKAGSDPSDVGADATGIQITMKNIGSLRKSKTKLGLTVTRKISIVLTDLKTKQRLAANNGLSVVGTSANNDEEEATTNSDNQLIGALADAIKNAAPGLIRD